MNKYKIRIILCYIAIVITLLILFLTIYSYHNYKKEINIDNNKSFNSSAKVVFNDTSNLSLINSKMNDSFTKTFSIENTSNNAIYYNLVLDDVINNYVDKDNIIYSISSSSGEYRLNETFPSQREIVLSDIKLGPNEKHNYNLNINILSDESDKTISSLIKFENGNNNEINDNSLLYNYIKNQSKTAYNLNLDEVEEEGIFFTNSSINGKKVYFYRGSENLNNNIVFNNVCYKIIRTTEDGGIRVIYNGLYTNNECSSQKVLDMTSTFNNKYNYNAYVGYMYGDVSSNNYKSEHDNINSSIVKLKLESYYKDELTKYSDLISKNTIYCNYRKLNMFTLNGVSYQKSGYSNNNTGYYFEKYPSYNCKNVSDRLSVNNEQANNVLSSPIGLISVDELRFAGFLMNRDNKDNYLYSLDNYWTMTSAYFNSNGAYNYSVNKGKIEAVRVDSNIGLRPVITLSGSIKVLSGDGSILSPYLVG